MSTQAEVHHTAQCLMYQYEVTVPRWYMEGWMRHGVFPPPLVGAANDTKSVQFHLALQDLWDLEGRP